MEHTQDVLRFERIEKAHETLAKSVAALASDSHTAFSALNISQQHRVDEMQRIIAQFGRQDDDVRALFKLTGQIGDGTKVLLTAQVLMVDTQEKAEKKIGVLADAMAKLAEAQAKSDLAHSETQGKLDALIDMWDKTIRERGDKNGAPPAATPPPA